MTAKNRNKSNSHDKPPAIQHDDALKKSQKNAPVVAGPSALMKLISAVFYVTLAGGAGIAALYFHQELSEIKLMNLRHEESMDRYTEMTRDVQRALQQVSSVQESLEDLESAVAAVKADLQSSSRAVQRGEAESRRLEETLQNLQNKIFRDLTNSIQEVKDARERDVSSLERTLEERLAQLSRSIAESVAEFSGEQSRYKNELQELKSHLEEQQTPALLKQELTSINSAVANLNTANEVSEGNVEVLREQIAAVSAELQTRNKEVASVSEEIHSVHSMVRSTVGVLREEVSAARTDAQAASDRAQALSDGLERSDEALQTLETQLREELLKVERRGEDVEARLKATEESENLLMSSLTEQTNKLDALTSKHESHESLLQNYRTAAETLTDDVEAMKRRFEAVELKLDGLADAEGSDVAQDVEITVDGPSEETDESE